MTAALVACQAMLGPLHCTRVTTHPEHRGCTYESTSGVAHAAKEGI